MSFRPQKITDFFNSEQVQKLEDSVKARQPCLVYGDSGTGKTTSVYFVAERLGLNVVEYNASDYRRQESLSRLLAIVKVRGFIQSLYLLDEADGIESSSSWRIVAEILRRSKHPVVLTANSLWKIPDDVKNNCVQLRYQRPALIAVVSAVRNVASQLGVKPRYEVVTDDFRASYNAALYGGAKDSTSNIFDDVYKVFKTGVVSPTLRKDSLIWLLDNANKFYSGRRLYEFIQVLCRADTIHSGAVVNYWSLISNFPHGEGGSVTYPYFLRRVSVLRGTRSE